MFAPALGTEGRSEILECLSLLQCVSSRVLDCTVSGTLEHTIVSVLLMFTLSPLHSSVLCQSPKRICIPVSICSANARSSAYRMSHGFCVSNIRVANSTMVYNVCPKSVCRHLNTRHLNTDT